MKDLCARLPYNVAIYCESNHIPQRIVDIDFDKSCIIVKPYNKKLIGVGCVGLEDIKPYLRPMSSMTSKEWCEYLDASLEDEKSWVMAGEKAGYKFVSVNNREDYLNSHHFDFRNLIDKGLAIDCTNLNIY